MTHDTAEPSGHRPADGDPFGLSGRTALVTGSSRGIGRAIASIFASRGAAVAVHCRDQAEATAAAASISAPGQMPTAGFGADLAEAGAGRRLVDEVIGEFGSLDIVVLNASAQVRRPFADIPADEFAFQVDVNLRATFEILQAALPRMAAAGWGRVLTIGSVQQVRPNPNLAVYAATKSAQVNLAINLAKHYAWRGITVNNLAPGLIDTDRNSDLKADGAVYERLLQTIPAKRAGSPQDCAWPALLLCSPAGSYITGADLLVDGGLHLP